MNTTSLSPAKTHAWVLYYSAHTKHFSLACPPPFACFEAFASELVPYVRSKSALQFPLDQPVPGELIANMASYQAKWNLENAKAKPKKTK